MPPGNPKRRCSQKRQCGWKSRESRRSCTALSHVPLPIKGGVFVCLRAATYSPLTLIHKPSLPPSHSPAPRISQSPLASPYHNMSFNGNYYNLHSTLDASSMDSQSHAASDDELPFLWQPSSPMTASTVRTPGLARKGSVLIAHCRTSLSRLRRALTTSRSTTTLLRISPLLIWRSSASPSLPSPQVRGPGFQASPAATRGNE